MDSCVLTSLVFSLMISASFSQEEPSGSDGCSSRFEYEFKMLQKLVDLENKQRTYEEKIQKLVDLENKQRTLEEKIKEFNGQITSQNSLIEEVSKVSTDKLTGTTYVRWGRTTCPGNNTDFVYRGTMAGNKYDQYGSGANQLCMPDDPTWGSYVDGYSNGAQIHGTEIEVDGTTSGKLFGKQVHNNDVPCAMCLSTRTSHMMLPARTNCYPGWTVEYRGYLVAGHPNYKGSSDYVCLDKGLELVYHGSTNDNDHVIRPVEVSCGSLPCPPYVEGREAACVVCTK